MKRILTITLVAFSLAILVSLAGPALQEKVQAAGDTITYDVACDCRTGVNLDGGGRATPFMIQGRIFPAGTLPSGTASNDPTQSVNGVASIGDWLCRGQTTFPIDPSVAAAYASTPFAFNTQYFLFKTGGAITAEGYDIPAGGFLSITGVGAYSGIAGFIEGVVFGTNATGCPNFRAKFNIQPGSMRGPGK